MLPTVAWCSVVVLMLVGLAGAILPLVPGTALIMAAAFGYKLMLPDHLSWLALALIGGVWLFSILADYAGVLLGTRWFGGSNWGLAGAGGGTLIGMFFSLRAMVLGAIFGAIAAEVLLARKTTREALRAGVGAASGFVLSALARLACGCGMITFFLIGTLSATSA